MAGWLRKKSPVFKLVHMYTQTNGSLVTQITRELLCHFLFLKEFNEAVTCTCN